MATAPTPADAARAPRGEARREHLLEATLRVVAEQGVAAVTHRRVAAEAGLPLAATTYWFASKEELMAGAYTLSLERDLVRLAALAAEAGAPGTRTPDEAARALEGVVGLAPNDRQESFAVVLLWLEAARIPGVAARSHEWDDACAATCAAWLRAAGCPEEHLDEAGQALSATLDGLLIRGLAAGEADVLDDVARPALRRLVAALGHQRT